MFKPSLPILVAGRSLAAMFGPRSLTFACSVIVVLLGFLIGASAQDKPADSQPSASTATGQTLSRDPTQTQGAIADAGPEQRIVHIVPFDRGASSVKNASAPTGAHLTYWGGPVISNVHVVVVFWGTNVDPVVTTPGTIDQFFADITNSGYYDLLTEYSTVGVTGSGTPVASSNQTIGRGQFDATVTIIPSSCPGPATCTLTDNQIQAELTSQLAAGHLPAPVKDAQGIIETFYMIYFPPGVHINAGGPSCAAGGFCAYHSNTSSLVPYGVLPDFGPTSGCQAPHCGGGTEFQNITAVTSHEMSEAVTDAQVGSANILGPPLAWYDPSPPPTPDLGEIGDICGGQDVTVSAGANTYMVQREFSNLQGDCVFTPPIFDVSLPAAVAPGSAFNATLTVRTTAGNFTTPIPGYTGTVHFTSSDAAAILPADYTFTATDAGAHTFSVTLSALGDQTITATDVHSSGFNGTSTTNVNTHADMVVSKNHTGNFTQGQPGTYSIVASNNGQGPTIGTVTVVDTLPVGMTGASISGTGWTCTLATLTCTRSDALARGANYPAIALVVNVAVDAPTFVVNNVAISGGGETNTANDTAADPTTVNVPPRPDLIIQKGHFGPIFGNFFQGETGATYTITVINIGNLASTGTVTVVDTLPAGLTATAISGTLWNCTLATLTCTRSDSLTTFGASYPPITVTVDVSLNASSTVTNVATVSGGGEVNTANDLAQDPTTILPPPSPDMVVGSSHFGPFLQGLTGTYDIFITNAGTGATTAPVTVVDTLPPGLSATSITGIGWTCSLQTVSCTRSDTIPFNSGYPDIFITVAVANNATSGTNTVTVSGGGETNTANDTSKDPTTVLPQFVDFNISISHPTGFTQGQIGATYFVNVVNNGTIASSGLVTVTNSLPASLTPTAIGGFGWTCTLSNLTCTRSDALSPPSVFSEIIVTVNAAGNAPDTVTVNASISGGGDSVPANNNVSDTSLVTKAVNIVPNGPSTANVTAGQPATFNFLAVVQSTAGVASFNCSGLPTGATCSFNPPTASLVGIPVTLTITTTARSTAFFPLNSGWRFGPLPAVMVTLGLLIMCLLFFPGSKRARLRWSLAFSVLAVILIAGCGGGGGNSFTPTPTPINSNGGTPVGTYAITVSATGSNAGSGSQVFTMTVK